VKKICELGLSFVIEFLFLTAPLTLALSRKGRGEKKEKFI